MAIAFDAAATSNATGTSLTFSHTCTGANLILWVSVLVNSAPNDHTDYVTGITYNGVAMTRAAFIGGTGTNNDPCFLYYLFAPATGAHNVVVSISGSKPIYAVSSSYTGAAQSGTPDSATGEASLASSKTVAVTVSTANSWIISCCGDGQNGSPTAGTGLGATRSSQTFESVTADSNATVSAGSNSITWNLTAGSYPTVCVAAFAPAVGGNTRFRSLLGVGQ
jgi:hypothetical protein